MPHYVAFLRAINVGGRRVKMEVLRAHFEALGLANVSTFIASGNVLFEAAIDETQRLEQQIERHLKQELGYEVATFLRAADEVEAIAQYQPFAALDEGKTLSVAFLAASPPDEAQQRLLALRSEVDEFHLHQRELYWLCRTRTSDSAFSGALLEKTLGMAATMRNITTVRKLAERLRGKD